MTPAPGAGISILSPQKDPMTDHTHQQRMKRKKDVIDARIAAAEDKRGVLLVNTGTGKGKSTAAFGLLARALGHGQRAGVVQFIKGRSDTGEEVFFRDHPAVRWHVMGEGFTWETQDRNRDMAAAEAAWAVAREMLADHDLGVVILDELNIALKHGYLPLADVLADLAGRPAGQHVVVTGRAAPADLVRAADTVTDMQPVKHAFKAGIGAQAGVEW